MGFATIGNTVSSSPVYPPIAAELNALRSQTPQAEIEARIAEHDAGAALKAATRAALVGAGAESR